MIMKSIQEIRIIDKEEAEMLYKAMYLYFSKILEEKGNKDIEVLLAYKIFEDLKYFVNTDVPE